MMNQNGALFHDTLQRKVKPYRWPLTLLLLAASGGALYMSLSRTDVAAMVDQGDRYNGFDVSNATIPKKEMLKGGPPRDGIPALLDPQFESAEEASTWLQDEDIVVGVAMEGEARAYPLRILVWHELANDAINDHAFLVTYCPLCGTAMVFDRTINGRGHSFGVSGLLYQSDVLMYDHETESLWSQLKMEAVSGPRVGKTLEWLPATQSSWAAWLEDHPDTKVLSRDTGYLRNYNSSPYISYENSDNVIFPVDFRRKELPQKDWVVGLLVDGRAKAYPVQMLEEVGEVRDRIGGTPIRLTWDSKARRATAVDLESNALPTVQVYWFAWQAFYPETDLYEQPDQR